MRMLPTVAEPGTDASSRRVGRQIVCAACGASDIVSTRSGVPMAPEISVKKLQQRGWLIGRRPQDHRCPTCNPMRKSKMAAQSKQSVPTLAASKRITDLYMLLEDHYDREEKCYRDGWSDGKVSSELDLDVGFVTRRREQDFGPLVVKDRSISPVEFAKIDEAAGRLDQCVTQFNTALEQMDRDMAAVVAAVRQVAAARDYFGEVFKAIGR